MGDRMSKSASVTRKGKRLVRMASLILASGAAVIACGDDDTESCTTEIRTAVIVEVSAPSGVPIDGVTVEETEERECGMSDEPAGDGSKTFTCAEQAPGTYVVRIHSGSMTWTRKLELAADPDNPCHVKAPPAHIKVTLTEGSAD